MLFFFFVLPNRLRVFLASDLITRIKPQIKNNEKFMYDPFRFIIDTRSNRNRGKSQRERRLAQSV